MIAKVAAAASEKMEPTKAKNRVEQFSVLLWAGGETMKEASRLFVVVSFCVCEATEKENK